MSAGASDGRRGADNVDRAGAPRAGRRWPRALRRGPLEIVACVVIATGILMLLQPFALMLYTYSFVVTLAGTLMFTVVSKFPD